MQIERVFGHAVKLLQPAFGITPERLDAVNVMIAPGKLIGTVVHPEMLISANIHQSNVTAPAVRVNHRIGFNMPPNHPLQRGFGGVNFSSTPVLRELPAFGAVGHNLGINHTVPLQQSKHNRFAVRTAPPFAPDTTRTKIEFTDLNRTLQRRLLFAHDGNLTAQFKVNRVHRTEQNTRQLSRIGRGKIHRKIADQQSEFRFNDSRMFVIPVFNSYLSKLAHSSSCLTS